MQNANLTHPVPHDQAQIVPARLTMSAAQAIEGLGQSMLTPKQANTWLTDSKEQFSEAVRDPWA
jgi:hypothetical protein